MSALPQCIDVFYVSDSSSSTTTRYLTETGARLIRTTARDVSGFVFSDDFSQINGSSISSLWFPELQISAVGSRSIEPSELRNDRISSLGEELLAIRHRAIRKGLKLLSSREIEDYVHGIRGES